ncbi:hypothetical protein PCANC_05393 [Puccinia coronata f. sp. avenae]|uniref:G-patch domain-containing protein n=2 Tax=Puccinia coronata f. sp. avenae TaxID=200324 RepID=A0A2N5T6T7_9BASI|nr:hypothetical protein PCANC_05393 [Puccinia coronata f. sp. avenae]
MVFQSIGERNSNVGLEPKCTRGQPLHFLRLPHDSIRKPQHQNTSPSSMSSLNHLSELAHRYHLKRTRSTSSSGSSSSSTSGYGSILSEDEEERKNNQSEDQPTTSLHGSHLPKNNHPSNSSDHQGVKLGINNKGMQMLLKMGWVEGNGLGVGQKGRKEPIPTPAQTPLLGLGKATQDAYMLSNAISKPKELESIIIARETEEAKVKREEKVKEIQTRVVEREDRLKTFHCHVCDKGYTTISQFEEHERSYAHHHAKRALEAKEARKSTGRSTEAKLEKERKREAKELERMARAAGMNLDARPSAAAKAEPLQTGSGGFQKPTSGWTKQPSTASASQNPDPSMTSDDKCTKTFKPSGFKSAGFAPISSSSSASGFKLIGSVSTEKDLGNPVSSSTSSRLPPTFVASTSAETGFTATRDRSTEVPKAVNPTSHSGAPQPTSKFAQIAARLAARKAAAAAASPSHADHATCNTSEPTSQVRSDHSEIEKMLNI